MQVREIAKNLGGIISKNSPTILTGAAVTGLITTVIFAVRATPKALSLIDEELYSRKGDEMYGEYGSDIGERICSLPAKDVVRITWKCYIPTAGVAATTVMCIVGANHISLRRNAALASVYSLTETAFKEYQAKVVETVGKNKELKVRDDIAADHLKENPQSSNEVIFTGKGEVMCYESLSGRYFKSDMESLRKVINDLNDALRNDMYVTLNELYYEIGLPTITLGDEMGWDVENGSIKPAFSTQLTDKGEPCLVLNFEVHPRHMR